MKRASLLIYVFLFQATQVQALTLEEVLHSVWDRNPQLSGQEEQVSLASFDRFRRFIPNEPTLSYLNSDNNTARTFGLQFTTAFPGKNIAFAQLDSAKWRAQKAELESKKYDLTKTFAQSYLDCASAAEALAVQRVTSDDLETVFNSLKTLYEAGHSTQAEKIGAELQSRQASLDLITAEDKKEITCSRMHSLLELNGARLVEADFKLPDDIDGKIVNELSDFTSDQNRAKSTAEVAQANASTAFWSQLPDITFFVNRNHYLYFPGSPNGEAWTTSYGVSITLPLLFPFYETVEAKRAKSQAVIDENVAQIQAASANADQRDGAREYRRSKARLLELRRKDLALGEALVESTYSAYRSGKLGYAELVLSRKTLNDLRLQDIQLRVSIINAHLRCLNQCDRAEVQL